MKKSLLLILSVGLLSWLEPMQAELISLPNEFTVAERFISLTSTFDISTPYKSFAIARKRFFSWTTRFDLEDMNRQPLASASSRFFAWGTVADVFDPMENRIGWIEEVTWKFISWPEYRLFNADNYLAASAKLNFWGTRFDLFEPDHPDNLYAVMKRPFIRLFRDKWTVQILNREIFESQLIDPRLLIMLAIYQTDRENRDRLHKEIEAQLRMESDDYEEMRNGVCFEPEDSLSEILLQIDALDEVLPYTTEEEAEADLIQIAHLDFPKHKEHASPLDAYQHTLKMGLQILNHSNLSDSERISLIRLLKEYKNI